MLLLLVNNQRLHEPDDFITRNVVEAIRDEEAYRHSSFLLNEHDEAELGAHAPAPDPANTFRPFSRNQEDLSGQVRRIVESIDEHCESARLDRIPTVVVWPERELSSASSVEPLGALMRSRGGPICVLCPDADPEKARRLAAALSSAGGPAEITVRSPKTPELVVHIRDVLHAGDAARPGSNEEK